MAAATLRVGLVGDRKATTPAHAAIPEALRILGETARLPAEAVWLPTAGLDSERVRGAGVDALWAVPGSPYVSLEGALEGIRFARERGVPFLGTCGGFQHAVVEFFRHVLGEERADHAESNPGTVMPVIDLLDCSLFESVERIRLGAGSRAAAALGAEETTERYRCRYGFSPAYWHRLQGTVLRITGTNASGEPRVLELDGHPFFVATLFQPELRARDEGRAHPLIRALLEAATRQRAAAGAVRLDEDRLPGPATPR
jgi:CTP synthase (UTP-ammonia lyase)